MGSTFVSYCLRESREAAEALFRARGSPARLPKLIFLFAEVPQGSKSALAPLRNSRQSPEASFRARGTPATRPMLFVTLAEVPPAPPAEGDHCLAGSTSVS